MQANKSEVSIIVILARDKQFSTTPNSTKVSTNNVDRQPEIATRPSNRKYLYLREYGRYHYSFDQGELAESVNKWL